MIVGKSRGSPFGYAIVTSNTHSNFDFTRPCCSKIFDVIILALINNKCRILRKDCWQLLFGTALGPTVVSIVFKAPTLGKDTLFKTGKLFFSANLCDTALLFLRKPPSGNSTIQFLVLGMYEFTMWIASSCRDLSLLFLPWKSSEYYPLLQQAVNCIYIQTWWRSLDGWRWQSRNSWIWTACPLSTLCWVELIFSCWTKPSSAAHLR